MWSYEYDTIGNIKKVYYNGELRQSYEYDNLNQLTRVNDKDTDITYCYSYDNGGNILQKCIYSFTTEELPAAANSIITYTYGDTGWTDLLTGYNGQTFTYDAIGNPLTYRDGMTMTWQYGRQLATINKANLTANFQYNSDGIRTSKTVNGIETKYYLDDSGTILAEDKGGTMVRYLFDENGTRIGLIIAGDSYYYDFNVQGDIVALRDSNGTLVANYTYDSWGKIINITDVTGNEIASTSHVANMNSFRYRGYYYDAETEFYYLNSRYYDPEIERFISTDNAIAAVGGTINGYNLYSYCFNNPVNMSDQTGNWPNWAMKLVAAVAIVAVVAVAATVCVATCGAGSVLAAAAVGAAQGAAIGLVTGAASGAVIGYATTGTLEGTLNGMADGALSGTIGGAISGGISSGIKTIAQSSSRVLWSGGETAKNTAASYAKSIGGTTLEQTPKGKLLTGMTNLFGYDKTATLWQRSSIEFASSARGKVTAIVSRSGYKGAGSILSQFEYPMVASRIMDGLIDSFNVILIR